MQTNMSTYQVAPQMFSTAPNTADSLGSALSLMIKKYRILLPLDRLSPLPFLNPRILMMHRSCCKFLSHDMFHLIGIIGVLPALFATYERHGHFDEVLSLLGAELSLERAHVGLLFSIHYFPLMLSLSLLSCQFMQPKPIL